MKLALHWKIIIGMFAGVIVGLLCNYFSFDNLVIHWIKPFGTIFINLLKLIAIPLILASLIKGVSDLHDINKFKSMGLWTFSIYIVTTVFAVSVGLIMVNIIKPGNIVDPQIITELSNDFADTMTGKIQQANDTHLPDHYNF
jgi:proton glutamate symport protein